MSNEDIKKTVSDLTKRVENLERQNQPTQPTDEQKAMDAAQEAHQAALTSFNTTRKDGMCLSLNSATPPAEAEALLKKLEQERQQTDANKKPDA